MSLAVDTVTQLPSSEPRPLALHLAPGRAASSSHSASARPSLLMSLVVSTGMLTDDMWYTMAAQNLVWKQV